MFLDKIFKRSSNEGVREASEASAGCPVGLLFSFPNCLSTHTHTLVLGTCQHKPDLSG